MAELFGSRTRFTQLALAKEIGGILATAIGPVLAATLTAVTGSWWPIAAMLVVYSLITLVSAVPRARDPRPRPGPAGGRGMKAVVVHGAGRPAGRRSGPTRSPGAGEVLIAMEWGGVCGSDLAYWRHGSLRHGRAAQPAGARARGRRPDRGGSAPASPGYEVGQPVTVHPAELVGDGCLPERIAGRTNLYPADPLLRLGGVRPAHRRRVQRAAGGPRRPAPAAARRRRAPSTERWPSRSPSRCTRCTGPATCAAATSSSTGPARSARWSWPQPSTAAPPPSSPPTSPTPRSRSPRPWAPTRSATWPPGDTLPEDAELVFEASGAPAALGERAPGDRPRRHARPGRQPARHRGARGARRPGHPGDHLDRARTGSSRRSATRSHAMRDGLDVSPGDHPPVRPRPGRARRWPWPRTGPAGSSKVMLRLGTGPAMSAGSWSRWGRRWRCSTRRPSGRPRRRVVAAGGHRRGRVQRRDRAGPARGGLQLDQPGRRRRAGHVRHPGDPRRGRAGARRPATPTRRPG